MDTEIPMLQLPDGDQPTTSGPTEGLQVELGAAGMLSVSLLDLLVFSFFKCMRYTHKLNQNKQEQSIFIDLVSTLEYSLHIIQGTIQTFVYYSDHSKI